MLVFVADTSSTNGISKTIDNPPNTRVKNDFVPVSTVFTSLNDYVNAGKDIDSSEPEQNHTKLPKSKIHHKFTNPNYAYADNDGYSTSDSEELCEEMVRRRSAAMEESNDVPNNLTYSDTSTNSSSTGTTTTSGPESLSQSNSDNEPIKEREQSDTQDREKLLESDKQAIEKDSVDVQQQTTTVPENLSYGSCPVPQDPMSLSNTFSNDVINLEGMSSISSMVEITSNYKKLKSDCKDDSGGTINDKLEKDVASLTSDFLAGGLDFDEAKSVADTQKTDKKPIGFESTMDDVSDTELESYLQELEDEAQETTEEEKQPEVEILDEGNLEQSGIVEKEDDGDNVSKASTIEFNEMRAKEQMHEFNATNHEIMEQEPIEYENKPIEAVEEVQKPHIEPTMFQSLDSLHYADSATTERGTMEMVTDESLDERNSLEEPIFEEVVIRPKVNQELVSLGMENEIGTSDTNQESLVEVVSNEVHEEIAVKESEDVAPETQESASKASRPNSLDIQNVTSPVEGELAENLNNQPSSPGHTPPPTAASRIPQENDTGMTSSSSEDFSTPPSSSLANPNESTSSNQADLIAGQLGKVAPYWVPDNMTNNCMQCDTKFSLIKRRHHCRSCGQLLCSACCCMKAKLEYMEEQEARICIQCDHILSLRDAEIPNVASAGANAARQPNPNNPMEYCSVIPPHQQVSTSSATPISVMVPVGVLKREGQSRNNRKDRNVIFSDGIRPGCDLTELDNNWDAKVNDNSGSKRGKNRVQTPPGTNLHEKQFKINIKLPPMDPDNKSYIPKKENALPPIYTQTKTEYKFTDVTNDAALITRLHTETLRFAVQRNFYVLLKIVKCKCPSFDSL